MSFHRGSSPEALHLDPGVAPGSLSLDGADFVGIDWGSTQARAWLFGTGGAVLDTRRTRVADTPTQTLRILLEGWPDRPVLACGMVGARGGWVEVPYVPAPAGLDTMAATALTVPDEPRMRVVGGVSVRDAEGRLADVMRGEETLVFGLDLAVSTLVVLPGTHSKWVKADADGVRDIRTFLTGDLFAALSAHTVLARSVSEPAAVLGTGLDQGLREGLSGQLTATLFGLRVADLDGASEPHDAWRRLSGLLIGDEIRQGLAEAGERPLVLVADAPLAEVYRRGFELAGRADVTCVSADEAARTGLWRLWRHLSC